MIWPFKKKQAAEGPVPTVNISELVSGAYPAFVAYRIDNGYLVRFGGHPGHISNVMYCANEQAIAETLITYRAKIAMGIASDEKAARYRVNPLYTSVSSSTVLSGVAKDTTTSF